MEIQDIIQGLTQAEITAITSPDERSLIVNTTLNQAVIYVNGTFKQASFEDTDDIPEGTNKFATSADLAAITANTLKVSFPEAPNDGKQYARKDLGWEEVPTVSVVEIPICPFGAKSDSIGKFLIANGKSTDADDSSKPKTRQPIPISGVIIGLAYKTKDGDTTTIMKLHINGVVEETITLSSMNANGQGREDFTGPTVDAYNDYSEIEWDGAQKPGECTMTLIIQPT